MHLTWPGLASSSQPEVVSKKMKDVIAGEDWMRRKEQQPEAESPSLFQSGCGRMSRADPGCGIEQALLNCCHTECVKSPCTVHITCCFRGRTGLNLNLPRALPGRSADSGAHEASQIL